MNALDMLGGFTQSAGPIGGADMGSAAGDSVAAPGAFDALVSQALEGSGSDVALEDADLDDETDPADSGVDLAFLIAMGGVSLPAITAPVVVETAVPSTGSTIADSGLVDGVSAAGAGVGMTLDTLPCTVTPAGSDIATGIDESVQAAAGAATVAAPSVDAPTGASTDTATISASAVAAAPSTPQTVESTRATSTASTVAPTASSDVTAAAVPVTTPIQAGPSQGEPSQAGSIQAGAVPVAAVQGGAVQADTAPADKTASEVTPDATAPTATAPATMDGSVMRARLARAARQAGGASIATIDPVRAQARADLQAALSAARGNEGMSAAPAETAGQSNPTPSARGVEPARGNGKTTKAEQGSGVPATAAVVITAASEASGSARQFGEQDGADSRGSARMTPAAAAVRAEATAPVFSLSAEPTGTAAVSGGEGVGDASPVPTGITAAESAQNVHSVVRSMRMQFLSGGGEAVLRLDPEHLGQVTLTVRVDQGRVAAHIQAETADASRWIETHQDELRSALEEQGLEVKELVVSTDPDGRREREQPRDPFRPRARRRSDDGATLPTFEVVV